MHHTRCSVSRLLFSAIVLMLLLTAASLAHASGAGEESPPEFNSPWGPARPTAELLAGSLGVVEASWWRKPLLLAWYRFNGLSIPAGAEDTFVYPTPPIDYSAPTPAATAGEEPVTQEPLFGAINPDASLPRGNAWSAFENCPGDSLQQARRTLALRRKAWGANSPALRDWLAAQQRVFARCPLGPAYYRTDLPTNQRSLHPGYAKGFLLPDMSLPDPPADAPLLLVKDRAYQRASALFYEGNYPQAASAFVSIARDKDSPWREWGMYLAFRARLREVQLVTSAGFDDTCGTPECLRQRAAIRAHQQDEARKLHDDIAQSLKLARKRENAAEIRRLLDLDALVGARLDPSAQFRKLAGQLAQPGIAAADFRRMASDYIHLHRQFPPSEAMGEWLAGLVNGYDPTDQPCTRDTAKAKPIPKSDFPDDQEAQCRRRQWSEESLRRFQRNPDQYAWLFSAAALAECDSPQRAALLQALAAVPDAHPGAASFMLHRVRLGDRDEALRVAEVLLARPDVTSDYSARNRVREYRLWHAQSLAEFWQDALREQGVAFDRDTLLQSAPGPVAPPIWGWDYDSHWILETELPFAALLDTATASGWPAALRQQVAYLAWSRAVLRKDAAQARAALAVLAGFEDSARRDDYVRLRSITDDPAFLLESGLLARGANIVSGCSIAQAKSPTDDLVNSDRRRQFGRFAQRLLSAEALAAWKSEGATLAAHPDLDSAWMQNVLDFAAAFPDDKRVPGLLREAVHLTRMNWCAEPSAGKLSKQAFNLLKRRYSGSREAQTTKYWFKPRS
ncbi:MAG: hypothetical protein IPH35_15630 [Rhodoferax sp.]|nr:hypothetical protein [Rhodoferax sp.]